MDRQPQLHQILCEILGIPSQVYFQPPANVTMKYPAIVYERDTSVNLYANNGLYKHTKRYQVTVIDREPDSPTPDKVEKLPLTRFVRHFAVDDLNHDVFNVHF